MDPVEPVFRRDTKPGPEESYSRRVVASYSSYVEAQRAVDHLSDEGFSVERVSIVAQDLRFVEQVTGRTGYGQTVLQGAGSGAVVGAFFGFFLGLLSFFDPVASALLFALYGLVFGAIVGAVIGLISHALSGGRRDFSSVGRMEASRYDVLADEKVADEASRLLASLHQRPQRDGRAHSSPASSGVYPTSKQ